MKVLHEHAFPVPKPVDVNRHVVVMELLQNHAPLSQLRELKNPGALFGKLMGLLIRLAESGLIHGDFNEFNLLIHEDSEEPVIIDFPQMVSIDHPNAAELFQRDVNCLVAYFLKRYKFAPESIPSFNQDVRREHSLDVEVEASGFSKEQSKELADLLEAQGTGSGDEDDDGSTDSDDSDSGSDGDSGSVDSSDGPVSAGGGTEPNTVSKLADSSAVGPTANSAAPLERTGDLELFSTDDRQPNQKSVAQRVRAQLQRQRQRQKVATRNNYKGREKRRLNEEASAWAAEKSYSGW